MRASLSPDKIGKFIEVIRNDWGFNVYRAVSDTKVKLSAAPRADFVLGLGDIQIEQEISRADFESWIADDIGRIELTVDRLLETGLLQRTEQHPTRTRIVLTLQGRTRLDELNRRATTR